MKFFTKAKGYLLAGGTSVVKIASSMGQTYFAMRHVGEYIFKTNVHAGIHVITGAALVGGLGVNLIGRTTANFRYYNRSKAQETNKQPIKLNVLASIIKYFLQGSAHLSGFFTGLNSYFGTIMLSEFIADMIESEAYDEHWKYYLIQGCSVFSAAVSIANYYSYDYKFLKNNAECISENIELRHVPINRSSAKTLSLTFFNFLPTAPVLAYFWTEPALNQIPLAKKYLAGSGMITINCIAGASAFLSTITTLPSTYRFFNSTEKNDYPSTKLSNSLFGATLVSGLIDSISAGACSYIGIVDTAQALLKLNPYGWIILLAIPCGLSGGANNALFLVRSGYLELMDDIFKIDAQEKKSLLNNSDSSESLQAFNFYKTDTKPAPGEIVLTLNNDPEIKNGLR